jgi:hypothetical protein
MRFGTGNYEPSNDLFKFLLLSVLFSVTGFFYILFKAADDGLMLWTDWLTVTGIGLAAAYFGFQTYRYRL